MNKFSTSKDLKMTTSNNDDFSFPIMPNPLASFMLSSSSSSSSSLWRISSRVFHYQEEEKDCPMEVQSMCDEAYSSRDKEDIEWASCQGEELDIEERMDCLWEDLNEQETKVSSEVHFSRESCELPRKQPRISRRSSSNKIVMMGRLLKGLVSFRKSAQQKIFKAGF